MPRGRTWAVSNSNGHLAAIAACHRLEFPVLFAAVAEVMQKIASEFKFVEVRRCLSGED